MPDKCQFAFISELNYLDKNASFTGIGLSGGPHVALNKYQNYLINKMRSLTNGPIYGSLKNLANSGRNLVNSALLLQFSVKLGQISLFYAVFGQSGPYLRVRQLPPKVVTTCTYTQYAKCHTPYANTQ